ncbi:conserved hypothetical protein [Rhodopseudomonas palustris TIE-1]|uniref:hypothetical protein n=1 Tax=Rhodopseudomonas palustris TaxID=1076 RepID=UPI0001779750|nr:hypothetical protein [Rhodopseudomonas palustris]ACF01516.1 conserved hypothetical protein [Rhodopseudomonas palustris TIE-1]
MMGFLVSLSLVIFGLVSVFAIGAVTSLYFALAPPELPTPPDVSFLASDAHFMVGGQHLIVPAVALSRFHCVECLEPHRLEKSKAYLQEASDPAKPMPARILDVSILRYRDITERSSTPDICPLLTRQWSKAVCRGQTKGILGRLPQSINLRDRTLGKKTTSGVEQGADRRNDGMRPVAAEVHCDVDAKSCDARIEALPGLLAVWTVWNDERTGTTASEMADRQGLAIVEFVRRAIGPVEDATLLQAE